MDKNEYELIKEAYLKLEQLALTKGVNALKRAAFIHPRRWNRSVAAQPRFEYFDFESDTVVYSRMSLGDMETEKIPADFLWISDVDGAVIDQKRRDDDEELAMKKAWKEEEDRRKAELAANEAAAELKLYKRLKRKYERKP